MSDATESPWANPFDAVLVLEDGRAFPGRAFGARTTSVGEIVFNTSMSGYQEILTDPSYAGQLVTMTSPHIGNVGVNPADVESRRIWSRGMIVRSLTPQPSNWRSTMSLPEWFEEQGVVGISEIDTRALTRHIRDKGVMKAIIAPGKSVEDAEALLEVLAEAPDYGEEDFVSKAMVEESTLASARGGEALYSEYLVMGDASGVADEPSRPESPRVVVLDFGTKHSILRLCCSRMGLAILRFWTSWWRTWRRSSASSQRLGSAWGIRCWRASLAPTPSSCLSATEGRTNPSRSSRAVAWR